MNDNNNPLVTELTARAGGASAADAAAAARAGSSGWGDLPGRTAIAVAASVLAVAAIAAASWGLSRHDGKESATPNAPESSDITFGPNQPDATPTVLPTLPDASTPGYPSNDVFSTPSYSTASAPSSYTTTGYPYSTSTTPYSPYTSTSSPTTTPRPSSDLVAPRADPGPAGRADRDTDQGKVWHLRVVARRQDQRHPLLDHPRQRARGPVGGGGAARRGYAIVSGATTRWDGHLGRFKKCPATIRQVTAAPTGDPDNPWQVTVRLVVPETEKRTALGGLLVRHRRDGQLSGRGRLGLHRPRR